MKNLILTLLLICFATSIYANPPIGARSVILNARFEAGNLSNPNYVSIQTNGAGGKFVRELNTNYGNNLDSIKLVGDINYYDLKVLTSIVYSPRNFVSLKYIDLSDANIVAFNRLDYTDYLREVEDPYACEGTGGYWGCDLIRFPIMTDTIAWCYVGLEDKDFAMGHLPKIFATLTHDGNNTVIPTLLDDLILPSNLKTIGDSAFVGVQPSTTGHKINLIIPETVTKIGKYAFASTSEYCGYDHAYGFDTIIIKSNLEIGRHAFPTMNKFVVDEKAYPTLKFDISTPSLTMERNSFFDNFGYLDFPVYNWVYKKKSSDSFYSVIQNLNGQAYNDSTKRVLISPYGFMDSNTRNFPDAANLDLRNWMLSTDSSKVGTVDLYVTKGTKSYYQNSNIWKYFNIIEFGNSIPTYLADTKSLEVKTYPNPFHEGFYVNSNEVSQTYSIINISGSVLQTFSANKEQYIDMSSFSNGIYFLKNNDDNSCTKLIKQ